MSDQAPDTGKPPLPLGELYAEPALAAVQAAVAGNGVKPEDVKIVHFAGQTENFKAGVSLSLHVKTSEKTMTGRKTGGEKVESAQGARNAVEKERLRILGAQDMRDKIRNLILDRKDKGFGIHNEYIKLPFLMKEYVWYEKCNFCSGQGETRCQRCFGKGFEVCPRCNGQGLEVCTVCGGSQYIWSGQAKQMCMRCNGRGKNSCSLCNERRKITCTACKTKGALSCRNCGGHGWISHIVIAEMQVSSTFTYERGAMPEKVCDAIDRLKAALPEYVEFTPLSETAPAPPETPPTVQEKEIAKTRIVEDIALEYDVLLPHADMQVSIGENKPMLFLLGRQCAVEDAPAFLDPLLKNGMTDLREAAQGLGNVAGNVKRAGRLRTIRQGIMLAARQPPHKALKLLLKNTPLGLSQDTARAIITDADRALKNLTAKPARMGMAAGLALAAALYAGYFLSPLRSILTGSIPNAQLHPALDAIVFFLGVFAAYIAVQWAGAGVLKKALAGFFPKDRKVSILPRTGSHGVLAALVCIVLFFGLLEARTHTAAPPVAWYVKAREGLLQK